jgi:signal transduction histidine kinase
MKIDRLLFIAYGVSGLGISLFTATMTYLIIGEPIGWYMFSEISLTVLAALPVIWLSSRLMGNYFARKVNAVKTRLDGVMAAGAPDAPGGEAVEEFAQIHDAVTELAARLERSIGELERKNRGLANTMRSLAHDMNTPLTIMQGYLEEIEDGMHSPEGVGVVVETMRREGDYLQELAADMMEYVASMQSGRPAERVVLGELLEGELFPLLRPSEGVSLRDESGEAAVTFNRMDLKKVLFNLLHNATKHTAEGNIRVVAENGAVQVIDSGSGIPPERAATLFEPMQRVEFAPDRKRGGFGVGLGIARNLAQRNGYALELGATSPSGTTFLLLPAPGQ